MNSLQAYGRLLIWMGILFLLLGIGLRILATNPGFGRLPGDMIFKKGHFTFYFPIVTSIVISIIVSLLLWLMHRA